VRDPLDPAALDRVRIGEISTRVYRRGAGEPLLLVHGGGFGSLYSLDSWSLILPRLTEHFEVVAFDKLGQGHTASPDRDEDWTMRAVIDHAAALVETVGLAPMHVVGHSMGGFLAARLALERPELVRTLVIVDSNTTAPDDPRYPWTAFYEDLARRIPDGPPTRESVRMEPDAQSWSRESVTSEFVERLLEIAELPTTRSALERLQQLRESVWLPSLLPMRPATVAQIEATGIPVPTLVVWGADDPSAPLPLAHRLFEVIACRTEEAELHVLARAGHYAFRDRPDAFVRVVTAFCSGRG
jgi:pimeloyl-ACP methyl ester carboxylesterase